MIKTAKVISSKQTRDFKGQKGQIYVHEVEFDNGDKGDYNSISKDQNKFVPGQEVEYEITTSEREHNGKTYTDVKIKPIKKEFVPGKRQMSPEEQKQISKQVAYECAIVMMKIIDHKNIKQGHDYVTANKFTDWLEEKSKDTTYANASKMGCKALREAVNTQTIPAINLDDNSVITRVLHKAEEIYKYFIA